MVEVAGSGLSNAHQCNFACVQGSVGLTRRSTGHAGTCLHLHEHRRDAPVPLDVRRHAITSRHQCQLEQHLATVANFESKWRVNRALLASAIVLRASKGRAASSRHSPVSLVRTKSSAKPQSTSEPVITAPSSGFAFAPFAAQPSFIPRRAKWTALEWPLARSPIQAFRRLAIQSTIADAIPGSSYPQAQWLSRKILNERVARTAAA